jgi:hypothetical protein
MSRKNLMPLMFFLKADGQEAGHPQDPSPLPPKRTFSYKIQNLKVNRI